ncbi:hypothetical protein JQX13_01630 [Archangium violaceum]|uniref:hypothetical protein n=1 Tax=Archangium violaceum TaxID=83451 RepID=UPI00193BD5F5|nr:hypothetical protein [Archangium violaceum]QRK08899.1 hypothetical protein JQX13_01630 [Archangium violaceum]
MSTDRVDKAWQRKGLKDYSTEAIIGTLGHYGVQVSEADFRQLAEKKYPSGIAEGWMSQWKGTGQFAPFPYAAAGELWKRWLSDRLAPYELSESLAQLMGALGQLLQGSQQAPVDSSFARMNEVRQRVPVNDKGEPEPAFMQEALRVFDERAARAFDDLAEMLAKAGHVQHAEAFSDLEEFLLPDRRGVSKPIIRAARGERDAALEDLQKVATDGSRAPISRVLAVDGLLHLGANDRVAAVGRPILEEAERAQDWHLALDIVARLEHAYKQLGDRTSLAALSQDRARVEKAHDEAHPGHRRHQHQH